MPALPVDTLLKHQPLFSLLRFAICGARLLFIQSSYQVRYLWPVALDRLDLVCSAAEMSAESGGKEKAGKCHGRTLSIAHRRSQPSLPQYRSQGPVQAGSGRPI